MPVRLRRARTRSSTIARGRAAPAWARTGAFFTEGRTDWSMAATAAGRTRPRPAWPPDSKQTHVQLRRGGASDDSDGSGLSNDSLAAGSSQRKRGSSGRGSRSAPQRSRPVFSERENTRFEDFQLRAVIGQGSFGVVLLGTKQHGLACGQVRSGGQHHLATSRHSVPTTCHPPSTLHRAPSTVRPPRTTQRVPRNHPPLVQHFALKVVSKAVLKEAGVSKTQCGMLDA